MDHRNFYGRIKGKALNAAQKRYLTEDLPKLSVGGISREDNPERSLLDMRQVASGKPLWLEIGFGGGEHLVHQALANPEVQFLGVEPYVNGVAMLLEKCARRASRISSYTWGTRATLWMSYRSKASARHFCSIPILGQNCATIAGALLRRSIWSHSVAA
jgi:hypothetical protein